MAGKHGTPSRAIWNALQRRGDGLATVVGETAAERNVRVRVGNRFMPCVAEAAAPAARRRRQRQPLPTRTEHRVVWYHRYPINQRKYEGNVDIRLK